MKGILRKIDKPGYFYFLLGMLSIYNVVINQSIASLFYAIGFFCMGFSYSSALPDDTFNQKIGWSLFKVGNSAIEKKYQLLIVCGFTSLVIASVLSFA